MGHFQKGLSSRWGVFQGRVRGEVNLPPGGKEVRKKGRKEERKKERKEKQKGRFEERRGVQHNLARRVGRFYGYIYIHIYISQRIWIYKTKLKMDLPKIMSKESNSSCKRFIWCSEKGWKQEEGKHTIIFTETSYTRFISILPQALVGKIDVQQTLMNRWELVRLCGPQLDEY